MRLFVAVWPPAEVVAALSALPRPKVPGLAWTTPEQWHVTLRFLGEADLGPAAAAFRAVAAAPAAARPVVAEVGPATGRFGRRVLHVPVDGLAGLAASTAAATAAVGRPPDDRPFRAHLTLARARPPGGVDLGPLVGAPIGGRWTVAELTLVASHLGRRGARYEVVETLVVPAGLTGSGPG